MNFWLVSVSINLKRLVRDRAFWIVTLLLWALLLAGCVLLSQDASLTVIRAGVLYSPQDELARQVYQDLPQHSMVEFVAFSPQEQEEVEQLVQTGKLECAYVFESPFSEALERRGFDKAVTLITAPNSVADTVLSEMVFSAVLKAYSPEITTGFIHRVLPQADRREVFATVLERLDYYESSELVQFLELKVNYVDSGDSADAQRISLARRPLYGVVALMLLALTLFALPRFIQEKTQGLWRRLGPVRLSHYYTSVLAALWALNLAAGIPALLIIRAAYPPGLGALPWELLMLAVYALALGSLGILCVVFWKTADFLYAVSVFVLLLALLLGGVLFDWAEINQLVSSISRWTYTEHYISGAIHAAPGEALWLLGAACAACAGIGLRIARYAKSGKM